MSRATMKGHELMIHGRLINEPDERTDSRDKQYTVCHVHTMTGNHEMTFAVISRVPKVSFTLQTLEPGDLVTLHGRLVLLEDESSTAVGISPRRIHCGYPTVREQPKRLNHE